MKNMRILVFAAHPDDEVLGVGGTIAKNIKKGDEVNIIVFSYGEGSDPLLDPEYLTQKRIKESRRAAKLLGCYNIFFLGISDLKFLKGLEEPSTRKKVEDLLISFKPDRIFVHEPDDIHPAHRAVANFIKQLVGELKLKSQIFTYSISSIFKLAQHDQPRLYVNIDDVIELKKKALSLFKTQKKWLSIYYTPLILLKNWLSGPKIGCRYAEVFYKW